ncbi:MAG: hypothetical protein HC922_10810 [Leptolyngbyaceae cyanobacterium SM2_3_12]|nr:hypothetical protein [Leptolyngbyaceae cyanobacterium SM2_3_12]
MTQPPLNHQSEAAMAAERDLLSSILNPEPPYPWNPLAPEAETYLASLETEFDDPLINGAITQGWTAFSQQLESQWEPPAALVTSLGMQIKEQFQGQVPEALLKTLVASATDLVNSGRPLIEQLVACVNAVLPSWDDADLAVLARPLAYSLRDGRSEVIALNLGSLPQADWGALSEIEQARLGLAMASMALKLAEAEGYRGE